jgi:hypothetical protein
MQPQGGPVAVPAPGAPASLIGWGRSTHVESPLGSLVPET